MRPGILPEHGFKHKGNHYASLPWFGTKIAQKYAIKGSKYSGFRRDVKPLPRPQSSLIVSLIMGMRADESGKK